MTKTEELKAQIKSDLIVKRATIYETEKALEELLRDEARLEGVFMQFDLIVAAAEELIKEDK